MIYIFVSNSLYVYNLHAKKVALQKIMGFLKTFFAKIKSDQHLSLPMKHVLSKKNHEIVTYPLSNIGEIKSDKYRRKFLKNV